MASLDLGKLVADQMNRHVKQCFENAVQTDISGALDGLTSLREEGEPTESKSKIQAAKEAAEAAAAKAKETVGNAASKAKETVGNAASTVKNYVSEHPGRTAAAAGAGLGLIGAGYAAHRYLKARQSKKA